MKVLLLRPSSPNERFGLGPFFRVEPLGLEYIAAALLRAGHEVRILDLRFTRSVRWHLMQFRPALVGIACLHTLDTNEVIKLASLVKGFDRSTFVLVGGHAAAVHPGPLMTEHVDAIGLQDGETTIPELVAAIESRADLRVPGFLVRTGPGQGPAAFEQTAEAERKCLDDVAVPARHLVAPYQKHYLCVHKSPLWAVETSRGCLYRCSFCSIWKHHGRNVRLRSIDAVCQDMQNAGKNIFIVDDLFWYPRDRSLELAKELARRGIRKDWMLVQARLDTVARHPELLEAWRPLSRQFDIFFGFEAATDENLAKLSKDSSTLATEQAVGVARSLNYGVTGNFVIDPDWGEADFEAMWAMVDRLQLNRTGYTILTPLPGTPFYEQVKHRIVETNWSHFDMQHILFEPKLGRQRFFEMFVKSWKRNVLSPRYSASKWLGWTRGLTFEQIWMLARVLVRTQRMLRVDAYLAESFPMHVPAAPGTYEPEVAVSLKS